MTLARNHSSNLDLLRSLAVMLVLADHLLTVLGFDHNLSTLHLLELIGGYGVQLFFIHTSLVLMMSILSVLLAVSLKIPPYFHLFYDPPPMRVLIANLLLFQNITQAPSLVGTLWSLPYEIQMYLVLPIVYIIGKKLTSDSYGRPLLVIACGFIMWFVESRIARAFGYPPLLKYAPWFAMGCASYFTPLTVRYSRRWYLPVLVLFVVALILSNLIVGNYISGWINYGISIVFCLALRSFSNVESIALRASSSVIATYSYGIYLSHVPIMWFAFEKLRSLGAVSGWVAVVPLLFLMPVCAYHLLEKPLIQLGARFSQNLLKRAPQTLASGAGA